MQTVNIINIIYEQWQISINRLHTNPAVFLSADFLTRGKSSWTNESHNFVAVYWRRHVNKTTGRETLAVVNLQKTNMKSHFVNSLQPAEYKITCTLTYKQLCTKYKVDI